MTGPVGIGQDRTPFDAFLQAEVGHDRNGTAVTVMSALARLGLDPCQVAADLSRQPPGTARKRLENALAELENIPDLNRRRSTISARLIALLPNAAIGAAKAPPGAALGFGPILAFVLVVLFVVQTLLLGTSGPGG
jgi:hypothetical protein